MMPRSMPRRFLFVTITARIRCGSSSAQDYHHEDHGLATVFSLLAHELRSPAAVIGGYARMLTKDG